MGILDEILEGTGFSTDGYGDYDANLVHDECGTMIEPDAQQCPVCKVPNPLVDMGLI